MVARNLEGAKDKLLRKAAYWLRDYADAFKGDEPGVRQFRAKLLKLASDCRKIAAPQVSDSASVGSKLGLPEPRIGPAIVNSPAVAAPCCHPWRGEGPEPASWYCCGVKVYRSYADYCD